MHRWDEGLPALIEDILETWDGRWFTVENLVDLVLEQRPAGNSESIGRAVWRVIAQPAVELERRRMGGRLQLRCPARAYLP